LIGRAGLNECLTKTRHDRRLPVDTSGRRVTDSLIANLTLRRLLALALLGAPLVMASSAFADSASTTAFAHLGPIVVHGNEADNLLLGAGLFDLRDDTSGAGTVEYRFGRKVFMVGFTLGLMANTAGGLFGYVGVYGDLSYKKLYVTPQLAIGGYGEGSSTDLGGVFQFRESLDLAYRFDNGHRLGIRAAHISNAHIHAINPGEEELLLTYSFPLGPYL
jgi:lipid A 3-O-deacylase